MTIKEYVKEYYVGLHTDIFKRGDYAKFSMILFPFGKQCVDKTSVNYLPFEYLSEQSNGGFFAGDVSAYIYTNFYDSEINKIYLAYCVDDLDYNHIPSSLKREVYNLLRRYKYKWQALYETMLVDSDYDMLDNVNEIFDETTTRTPNLTHSETGSNVYGEHETTQENVYGGTSKENNNLYGARIDTKQFVNGERTDSTNQTIGAMSVDNNTTENRLNDTSTTEHKKVPFDGNASKVTDVDSVTNTYGGKTTTSATDTSAQSNSSNNVIGSQTNSETDNIGSYSDTLTEETKTHTDNLSNLSKSHTDTTNSIRLETGNEQTVITRRRHGNVGITTSGQLIADYRNTHYFDLVKIIGDDIANEILSMVW